VRGVDPFGWIGTAIDGRFAVEAITGVGAFGIVYRGRHLGLGEPIAVKCLKIPASLTGDEQARFLASFQEEARLLHRLSRRTAAIVQALDVGAASSPSGAWTPYIVMEWLEGETLQDDLDRRVAAGTPPRTLREAMTLLTPAADALAIAHGEGISHRDVKPGNLFLARAGAEQTVKVVDFGIAKVLADAPSLTHALEQTGGSIRALTPMYGAPEQFDARFGATGPWTDVFAMALIVIELASGKPALAGMNAFELFGAAIADDRPSLSARGIVVGPAIEQVLRRALEVDPARRFKHLGHFWAALSGALHGSVERVGESDGAASPAGGIEATLVAGPADATARDPQTPGGGVPVAHAPGLTETDTQQPSGENRVCTLLLADTSGFAALSERLDPEAVAGIIDECNQVLTREIEGLGGAVYRSFGDSLMAVFGAPRATDNDAERAVAAALAAQAALGRMPHRALRRHRPPVTIVIHTGRVFAGRVGGTSRKDFTIIGEAVNLAARLLPSAPKGSVVIGRDTQRHVAGLFEVEPIEPAAAAYRVLGRAPGGRAIPPSDFHGLPTKLVGRGSETSGLTDLFDAVAAEPLSETVASEQRAQLVTLVGPPGVGRSRLLAELARGLGEGALVVLAQCSPLSESTSYALAAAVLRAAFHLAEDDPPAEVERKLRRGVRVLCERSPAEGQPSLEGLDEVAGAIASIVGAHASAPTMSMESLVPDEEKSFSKHRVAAAFARLLGFAAERQPVVLLCDDAQWADDASLDLLDDLVVRLGRARLLVAIAARPLLYERRPHWGEGKQSHVRLEVGPLSRRHIEEMARDRLRKVRDLSSQVVRTLVDRAEGSALTLVETLHLLVDAGVIDARDPEAWIVHEERLTALALPATVQGIVQARLDRLEPDERAVLGQASVVGRTFWEGAVERLRRASAATTGPMTHDLLTRLRDKHLIRLREASAFPAEREYVFAESATQEVAYAALSARVRQPLHRQVAAWLEEVAPGDGGAALVGRHWDKGGEVARAFAAYARAAAHAAALGQNAEAKNLLGRAREIHDETAGGTGEHPLADPSAITPLDDDARVATWRERTALRLDLGDILRRLGELDQAEQSYEEARARIFRKERRTRESFDPTEVMRWEARVDFRLALTHKLRGATTLARQLVERAIANAEAGGAIAETPAMWALLAAVYRRERDLEACRAAVLRGLRVARGVASARRGARPSSGVPARRDERWRQAASDLLISLGGVFYSRGQLVRAERCYRQAARAVDQEHNPQTARFALNNLAVTMCLRGDNARAREVFREVLALSERVGDLYDIAVAHNNLAELELRLESPTPALEHARRSVTLGEQVRAEADLPDFYRNLAEASSALGDREAAVDAASKGLSLAERGGGIVYLGEVAMTLARVSTALLADPTAGEAVHSKARDATARVRTSLAKHFGTPELAAKAEACRAILDENG